MNAHFIDINIILKQDQKPWIVSKDNPNIPIMKIDRHQFNSFKSGIYKHHNNKINFNGETFYLSNDFMNKLKIKTKLNDIDISNLAISMQEFLNPGIIEDMKFSLDMSLFNSIINTNDHIYIICSKNKKKFYTKQIEKLQEELESIGLYVKNYYFLSETFYNRNSDEISYIKVKLLLQHLIGLKTSDGERITDEDIENYEKVTYYDDERSSIELAKNINSVLEKLLINTEDSVKSIVKDRIRAKENLLHCKFYTHNNSKKFEETLVPLEFSNVIRTFESFKMIKESKWPETSDERIDLIKTIFTYLTDEWDDMVEGKFLYTKKNVREIKYTFLNNKNLKHVLYWMPEPNKYAGRYPLLKQKTGYIYKPIDISNVFFAIYIDMTGPNDLHISDFYNDVQHLLKDYETTFDVKLLTTYSNITPESPAPIAHFLILFYDDKEELKSLSQIEK